MPTGESLPMIYLGFKKAFDSVAHKGLMLDQRVCRGEGAAGTCRSLSRSSRLIRGSLAARKGRSQQSGRAGPSSWKGRCAGDADSVWTQTLQAPAAAFLLPATLPPHLQSCMEGLETSGTSSARESERCPSRSGRSYIWQWS